MKEGIEMELEVGPKQNKLIDFSHNRRKIGKKT
jgi:hypothetical protein